MSLPEPSPPPPDRRRWSKRTHRLLFALAGLLFLGALVSVFGGDHFYRVDQGMPHWLWFTCAATIPQAASAFDENRGRRSHFLPPLLAGGLAVVVLGAMTFIAPPKPHTVSASSVNGDTTAVFTIQAGSRYGQLDVHQNRGALSRLWYAGCLNGGKPANAFADMAWIDASTLEVHTKGGQHLVIKTDSSGRPLNHITTGENVCR
jgi:hypothetical protein